jgi:ATP-dependent DNA helicase DinG
VFENAARILEGASSTSSGSPTSRAGAVLRVAPMSVAMLVRDKVLADRTVVVLTSATLELGGSFDAVAGTMGLRGEGAPSWTGLDVGSPVRLPAPGDRLCRGPPAAARAGRHAGEAMDELEALVRAAGGRTLGLFSSMRAAQAAAESCGSASPPTARRSRSCARVRTRSPLWCGSSRGRPTTCLFGTLSLWQGVDVPGSSCQLVVIDRIPFPRPDDPLASARTQAIARMGGNGFMAVSATHAALRLAQGRGRLVRRSDDRGVVAFLDSRMSRPGMPGSCNARCHPSGRRPTGRRCLLEPGARGLGGAPLTDPTNPTDSGSAARTAVTGGHAWTAAQDAELRDAAALGVDLDELVEHLELPVEAVTARLAQLGLELGEPQLDLG